MSAKRIKTNHQGIYKRGDSFEIIYRDQNRKQQHETTKSLREAIRLRAQRVTQVAAGELQSSVLISFSAFMRDWIETYPGRGRRGFRESTRKDYRRDINRNIGPFFDGPPTKKLGEVTPRDVARFVAWLCDPEKQGRFLADATIRRILSPLRAAFTTAVSEGVVRHNPTSDIALPARDQQRAINNGTDHLEPDVPKALSTSELLKFIQVCPSRWRLYFSLLAATGMRVSESFALRWVDIQLDGSDPHVHVRRAYVRGAFGPPKSKYGYRKIPIDHQLVVELRRLRAHTNWCSDRDLVFPSTNGEPLRQENVRRRVLKPTAEEAGVPWAAFHTFRHTCATRLFAAGRNPAQVQRWLGHHSPAFTLSTYVHLLNEDFGKPLSLPQSLTPSVAESSPVRAFGKQDERDLEKLLSRTVKGSGEAA